MVTPQFAAAYHKGVGDTLTLRLASPEQVNQDYDGSTGPPRGPSDPGPDRRGGPLVLWRPSNVDGPGRKGGVLASPALFRHYRANILGTNGQTYINALSPAQGRRRGHPRVPRRPGPGDRPVGHRRVEQP